MVTYDKITILFDKHLSNRPNKKNIERGAFCGTKSKDKHQNYIQNDSQPNSTNYEILCALFVLDFIVYTLQFMPNLHEQKKQQRMKRTAICFVLSFYNHNARFSHHFAVRMMCSYLRISTGLCVFFCFFFLSS